MIERINKLLDRLESRWALLLLLAGNVSITGFGAFLASITEWAILLGPLGWLFAGLGSALVFSTMLYVSALFSEARSRRELNKKRAEKSTHINILEDHFEGEIIHVHDLWSFQHQLLEGKRFHKCRFVGPMVIAFLDDVSAVGISANHCNFIEIGTSLVYGVVGFKRCFLTDCEYDSVTFLVNENMRQQLETASGGSITFVARPSQAP